MEHTLPFGGPKTCDWCERRAVKSTGADGTFVPQFHLCALHAAAPELLKALENIAENAEEAGLDDEELRGDIVKLARAAIQKAKS